MMTTIDANWELKSKLLESLIGISKNLKTNQISELLTHAKQYALPGNNVEINTYSTLSEREIEVLTLLSSGYTRKNIGVSLGISANTAARHISNIYRKLGVSTAVEATQYACSINLFRQEPANEDTSETTRENAI